MITDKRKEDQRLASQALRDKKAASTDRLSQIVERLDVIVDNVDKLVEQLKEKGDERHM